jgi:hypothetical protein
MAKSADEERKEFLSRMYDQMFNDINTHILVVWQSAGVLIAAFAVLALVEKDILPLDVATALLILIAGWLLAHLEDASYWYNRNLVIIANIERQFLQPGDLRNIHYYFGKHRAVGKMIDHLRIQYVLGIGIASIMLCLHFSTRVWPGVSALEARFELMRALPYVVTGASGVFIMYLRARYRKKYEEFLTNSPGAELDTSGINYGVGHPDYTPPKDE